MKEHYDFSKAKRNPYAKKLKNPITIRIEAPAIEYFRELAMEMDVPYQTPCGIVGLNATLVTPALFIWSAAVRPK